MRPIQWLYIASITLCLFGCGDKPGKKKTVWAIPVYGQSLALGEEAVRITDFDSLAAIGHHRILTENLDEKFGYYSDSKFKHWLKKLVHDHHRSFELSVYGMGEALTEYFDKKGYGDSVVLCTFPEGQGSTSITGLGRESVAYKRLLEELSQARDQALRNGWDFVVPAFCWMQGEDDIVWKTSKDYKKDLSDFQEYFNRDAKAITGQQSDITCICYQTNCLTLANGINTKQFNCPETYVPEAQMELIREKKLFVASGPTYPYSFVDDRVHIDGRSQKQLGYLAAMSVIRLMEGKESEGLIPTEYHISGDTVKLDFSVPVAPLVFDTALVTKVDHYGFSVVSPDNTDILNAVSLKGNQVQLYCKQSPVGAKLRYAVNGQLKKSGHQYGPRGNLRDSQGDSTMAAIKGIKYPLHNWCYQFDILIK
jgi:hypothetical protein